MLVDFSRGVTTVTLLLPLILVLAPSLLVISPLITKFIIPVLVDLQVTEKCFEHIKNSGLKYHFKDEKHEFSHPLYEFDDVDAEFFVMPLEEIHFDYVDGYPCQDVLDILAFKKQRNLPKDQEPIAKIETYLNTKKR